MSKISNGKLTIEQLNKLVYTNLGAKRTQVITNPCIGQDCGYFKSENDIISVSSDPITATSSNIGALAVIINLNDIAASFAEPFAITVTILCPSGTYEDEIKDIMHSVSQECLKNNVQIIGGHTEVTSSVNKTIVSITALGKLEKDVYENLTPVQSGQKIYMSKQISLEGTMIICDEKKDELKDVLNEQEFQEARDYINELSVLKDSRLLRGKKISLMHDVTEGGIFGAIYEMMNYAQKGCIINYDAIRVSEVTKKVCQHYNLEYTRLISSGCMLIITEEDLDEYIDEVKFTLIGEVTNDCKINYIKDGIIREITEQGSDEIYKVV